MSTGIGNRIKTKRIELGLSQEELAKKLGLKSKSTVCKIERGVDNLTPNTVAKYAAALSTTPAELMGWSEDRGGRTISVTDEEYRIVLNYRSCSAETKEMIQKMAAYGTEIKKGGGV